MTLSASDLTVPEGQSRTYTVVLDALPTANVTVAAARQSGGDTDLTVSPASRTFTTSNWDQPQTFTVSAANEPYSIGFDPNPGYDSHDGSATFAHTATSSDTDYEGIAVASLAATEDGQHEHDVIWYHPGSGPTVRQPCLREGETTAAFMARLTAPPTSAQGTMTRSAGTPTRANPPGRRVRASPTRSGRARGRSAPSTSR